MQNNTAPSDRHTPGPWKAHQGWADPELRIDAEKYPHWCEVTGPEGPNGHPLSINGHFGIANARLIAAAPELLEALTAIIEIGKRDLTNPKYDGYFATARDAIAKAEGGAL